MCNRREMRLLSIILVSVSLLRTSEMDVCKWAFILIWCLYDISEIWIISDLFLYRITKSKIKGCINDHINEQKCTVNVWLKHLSVLQLNDLWIDIYTTCYTNGLLDCLMFCLTRIIWECWLSYGLFTRTDSMFTTPVERSEDDIIYREYCLIL